MLPLRYRKMAEQTQDLQSNSPLQMEAPQAKMTIREMNIAPLPFHLTISFQGDNTAQKMTTTKAEGTTTEDLRSTIS